ncbi:MAG: putative 2-dehydropantoate 2-reductase [Bacillota bacterium]
MADWKPTVAIIGSGALGSYYGGRLAQHGHDVHFLLRSDYGVVVRNGLSIRSCHGDFALPSSVLRVYNDPHRMPRADLVIVTLKATANDQYEALIRPLIKDNTVILTLQNGLGNEERLAELFGTEHILGGLAFVCVNRIAPGVIHHLDYGLIRVGEFIEGNTANAERIVRLFTGSRIECNVLQSLRYGRWEKLVWNVPFNGLGAVLDMATDRLLAQASGEELVRRIMGEVVAAAAAWGIHLPPDAIEQRIHLTRTMGAYRSSMQIDRALGRPMEVEAILGEPVRAAQRAGIQVPHMATLYHLAAIVNSGNLQTKK